MKRRKLQAIQQFIPMLKIYKRTTLASKESSKRELFQIIKARLLGTKTRDKN